MDNYGGKIMSNEEMEVNSKIGSEDEEVKSDPKKYRKFKVSPINISCDVEVNVETKNKIIYVYPGKVQYFTISAISGSDDQTIEMEYCGSNVKSIGGEIVIQGCLGYYKIVKPGIIFIPNHKLPQFHNEWFATDILCFKVKSDSSKSFKYDVVFTYSKYAERDNKYYKFNKFTR